MPSSRVFSAYGKGRIPYVGAVLDDKLLGAAAERMTNKSGVTPVFEPVPEGVKVSRRVGPGKQVFVLINYSQHTRGVNLPHAMNLVLGGTQGDAIVRTESPSLSITANDPAADDRRREMTIRKNQ
ncbi:MAG: hypothetical protein LAO30_09265 [Acidobacteriia bacterium]|nr:hypothetical protein [Terriglobia bacterium]